MNKTEIDDKFDALLDKIIERLAFGKEFMNDPNHPQREQRYVKNHIGMFLSAGVSKEKVAELAIHIVEEAHRMRDEVMATFLDKKDLH